MQIRRAEAADAEALASIRRRAILAWPESRMEVSANVRRAEPTPRREQDGETYNCASRVQSERPRLLPSEGLSTMWPGRCRWSIAAAQRSGHREVMLVRS